VLLKSITPCDRDAHLDGSYLLSRNSRVLYLSDTMTSAMSGQRIVGHSQ
jgi:hypothetical protein